MHTTALAAVALALASGPLPPPQAPATDFADIDAYIESRLEQTKVPGAAWAVVTADGIEHQAAWGEDGGGAPVTGSTPFLWGSVAKPVTATAVMTLVEDGRIDLDEPARAYLPEFTLADPARAERITVRHLLEQTSGIPEGTGVTDRFDFDAGADPYGEALADLAEAEPFAEPGAEFEYASANYLVLGALVQAVSGMDYEDYLREAVLDPLGMDTAVADADAGAAVPDGHTFVFGQPVAIDAPFDPTGPSYGYLGGSAADLAAFASASLPGGEGAVSQDSLALMQTPAVSMNERIDYGLGWKIDDRNADLGTTTVWHTGGAPGYFAAVVLLPELDRAVVIAQNAYGHFQDGALVGTALGAARIAAGGDGYELESDWTYPAALAAIAALLLLGVVLVIRTVRRLRSGVMETRRRWTVWAAMAGWVVLGTAVTYAAAVAVPAMAPSRILYVLMAPDLAWGLYALGLVGLTLAAMRLWQGARRLRGHRTPADQAGRQ
ncbi:serine hydrolase [Glycomyces sp. NRRL B-16210]|uniref:serine hydrolase domain-containing protein n=1 Tax=Glycomyces sp. NRRL B-16210 TaxID=1463821 RepID=UPI00068A3147|nr:serine hydrolase domain-containing protein [Glycomyces sp. NRRL B-16210]